LNAQEGDGYVMEQGGEKGAGRRWVSIKVGGNKKSSWERGIHRTIGRRYGGYHWTNRKDTTGISEYRAISVARPQKEKPSSKRRGTPLLSGEDWRHHQSE